jgi:hypothetical protein
MKTRIVAGLVAVAALAAAPAFAQQSSAQAPAAASTCSSKFCVDKTPIGTIWADPKGKEVLLKQLPPLEQYMDQIKDMTLSQVAPMSQGAIDDAKLKAIQADLDALK